MKTDSTKKTLKDVVDLASAGPSEMTVRDPFSSPGADRDHQQVGRELQRILDNLNDRIGGILRALGIEMTQVHASFLPLIPIEAIAEKLSHVEIIPEVRTNVMANHN
jgi:hypothetical protein